MEGKKKNVQVLPRRPVEVEVVVEGKIFWDILIQMHLNMQFLTWLLCQYKLINFFIKLGDIESHKIEIVHITSY